MPILMYYSPANPKNRYWTTRAADPNIPAGYVDSQGSDGATPEGLQKYVAGINSGGYPAYTGDPTQSAATPSWPNGILGAAAGNANKT